MHFPGQQLVESFSYPHKTKLEFPAAWKRGRGGHSEKGHMVRVESFEKGTFCVCALFVNDKRGISNIMWKSTSIFIGTGRLTVED